MEKKKVGIVQSVVGLDRGRNLERALGLASGSEVDFAVFPELFTTGYDLNEKFAEDAGKVVSDLSSFARKRAVNVIGGSVIESYGGRLYNTCFVFNRSGSLVGGYSKRHLFKPLGEHMFFSSGNNMKRSNKNVFTLDGLEVGVMICYDLRFSDVFLDMKHNCASIIFCPMEWPDCRTEVRECFARVRAAESFSYLVAANATGYVIQGSGDIINGCSSVSSPSGETVFRAGSQEGFYVVELDLDAIKKARCFFEGGKNVEK